MKQRTKEIDEWSNRTGIPASELTGILLRAWSAALEQKLQETGPVQFRIPLSGTSKLPTTTCFMAKTAKSPRELVEGAERVITSGGGNTRRPPPKRQHIDELSYSYGLLAGVASALDCSLAEVIERFGKSR